MRSGYFKQGYGELVVLTDSPAVKGWTAALLLVMALAPFVLGNFLLSHLTIILFTTVGALGLMVLTGFTGLISLGHVGFLMLGGYAYAIAVTRWGLPPEIALVLSAVLPALFGLIVGIPSLRLHGLYLVPGDLPTTRQSAVPQIAGQETEGVVFDDVALVSYDNRRYSRVVRPRLTTVSLPAYEMGRRAAELLWAKLQGEAVSDAEVRILGQLHVRESCGAPADMRTEDASDIGTTVRHRLTGIPPVYD